MFVGAFSTPAALKFKSVPLLRSQNNFTGYLIFSLFKRM